MEKQVPDTNYKTMMKARKDGLLVQSEREFREEQESVMQNHIQHRQNLFDSFYGDSVSQPERNEFYMVIERERRKRAKEEGDFYPKAVRNKMQQVRELIAELRDMGVNENALTELVRPERPISRIYITTDYRIFLPEFDNLEVKLHPLPKTVFLLFLRHPEGIVLKQIGDYFVELCEIYKGVKGRSYNEAKAQKSLASICNPISNRLNEKISRIHEGLCEILDETIAANYYIQGQRGEVKQILIPRALINWQC